MRVRNCPTAIPYRNFILGNYFYDNENGVYWPCNGSIFRGNVLQKAGFAFTMTTVLATNDGAGAGEGNVVAQNVLTGDYSIVGGYRGGATDIWIGNFADDVAEAEVADNGLTILPPA
jgi:hypothetical protein